jgi:hypothetical protein
MTCYAITGVDHKPRIGKVCVRHDGCGTLYVTRKDLVTEGPSAASIAIETIESGPGSVEVFGQSRVLSLTERMRAEVFQTLRITDTDKTSMATRELLTAELGGHGHGNSSP